MQINKNQTAEECFETLKPPIYDENGAVVSRQFLMALASDSDVLIINEWRKLAARCIRGTPFNEVEDVVTTKEYIENNSRYINEDVSPRLNAGINALKEAQGGVAVPNLEKIDDPFYPPSSYVGRGNYKMASIHQLEHEYQQLNYLIEKKKLPVEFFEIVLAYKYVASEQRSRENENEKRGANDGRERRNGTTEPKRRL